MRHRILYTSLLCILTTSMYSAFTIADLQEFAYALFVPYHVSANTAAYPSLKNYPGYKLLSVFETAYEQHNFLNVTIQTQPKIPLIIHQIWLGGELPDKYKRLQKTWIAAHPDWEYKLWNEKEIQEFGLINQELFDAAPNYGEKSDIARYEILYRYGGLYVDTDFECLRQFTLFHHAYDFYTGQQPLDGGYVLLNNGLIACAPGHPILRYCVEKMLENKNIRDTQIKTGPVFFTKAVITHLNDKQLVNGIFPPTYFYPLGFTDKASDIANSIKFETFAAHYNEASWTTPAAIARAQKTSIARRGT